MEISTRQLTVGIRTSGAQFELKTELWWWLQPWAWARSTGESKSFERKAEDKIPAMLQLEKQGGERKLKENESESSEQNEVRVISQEPRGRENFK